MANELDEQDGLAGGVFVVTGATQGIGEAIASRLAKQGAAGIVVAGRDKARADDVVQRIEAFGAKAIAVTGDLAEVETCR